MFDCYAEPYKGEKCLDMGHMNKLQNPDVKPRVERLNWLINDMQFEGVYGPNKITIDDLDAIIKQYEEFLLNHFKAADQKRSVRKLIENL